MGVIWFKILPRPVPGGTGSSRSSKSSAIPDGLRSQGEAGDWNSVVRNRSPWQKSLLIAAPSWPTWTWYKMFVDLLFDIPGYPPTETVQIAESFDKLLVAQLLKIFFPFYGTWRLGTGVALSLQWLATDFNLRQEQDVFLHAVSSPSLPVQWVPVSVLLPNWYHHSRLALTLRTHGAVVPLPHTSWRDT